MFTLARWRTPAACVAALAVALVCAFRLKAEATTPDSRAFRLQAEGVSLDRLSWMSGCWRQDSGGRVIDEFWMTPAGGLMLGTGRTIVKGRVVEFEFMQIREDAGRLTFTAKPSGQAEASFAAIATGPREVIFENPAHDFPQRVIYRLAADTLTGRIEGTQNGKARSVDYPLRRVPCP